MKELFYPISGFIIGGIGQAFTALDFTVLIMACLSAAGAYLTKLLLAYIVKFIRNRKKK